MNDKEIHKPVLLNEVLQYIPTYPGGKYFDGTVGFGGHSNKLLEKLDSNSLLIGTDKDVNAFEHCSKKFENDSRVKIYNTGFVNINVIAKLDSITKFNGILLDLGVSSFQLDDPGSGFSYRTNAPLDLRMKTDEGHPASYFINNLEEEKLKIIMKEYGEERNAHRIAKEIIRERSNHKIETTDHLTAIVEKVTGQKFLKKSLSRVYQAFRIYVNNELDELKTFLSKSIDLLKEEGRILIISFHSLEDRIVKDFFRYESLECICPPEVPVCMCEKEATLKVITKKPIVPLDEEVKSNPRARSAKLRVAERI